jgi:hypothetical protein
MLLKQAVIHRIGDDPYASREYVLVPADIPLEFVMRDPKLKLASLCADKNVIFGAQVKTVNIGGMVDVCGGLVDAALEDASLQGEQPQGMATLHGLYDWVVKGTSGEHDILLLNTLQKKDIAVVGIATAGVSRESHPMDTFRYSQHGWEELAKEFANRGLGEEATLYMSKGGELAKIEHLADTSESCLMYARCAMAKFLFQ